MNFYKYTMTLILIDLNINLVSSAGNVDGLNQLKDGNLNAFIMEAIERAASKALEQKLPKLFPTSKTASHVASDSSSSSSSLMDERILRAIDESVVFHLDKIMEKHAEYLLRERRSYATLTKSTPQVPKPASSSQTMTTSSAAPPTHQTKPLLSEGTNDGSARPLSYVNSLKQKAPVVPQNQPPTALSQPLIGNDSSGSAEFGENELTMLLVPKIVGGPSVQQEFDRIRINLSAFGVRRTKPYASGALLVVCYTAEDRKKLEDVVRSELKSSVSIKGKQIVYAYSVRVQKIPIDVTEDEITDSVQKQFSARPENVIFMPYRDNRIDRLKAVAIYVDDDTWQAMRERPYLRIREFVYEVDTTAYASRCSNCGLLGHRAARCGHPRRSAESIAKLKHCIDCRSYNDQILKLRGKIDYRKIRDDTHPTDDDMCPSKRHFMKHKRHATTGEESTSSRGKSAENENSEIEKQDSKN